MWKKQFSKEFKDSVVTKIVNRGGQTIAEVCRQAGISLSAGRRWISERDMVPAMKNSKRSEQWTAEAKLNAIIQSTRFNEEELGAFLRKEGLHSHQIDRWRAEILTALGPVCRKQNAVKDNSAQRIKELERDLNRKDKALAEASALLILQKKVNLIWGNQSEDEK
jgi:transposase-like protein